MSAPPFDAAAEGSTADEAIAKLRTLLREEMPGGKRIISIELEKHDNPWLNLFGTVDPADPLTREWKEEMAAHRRDYDENPDCP